MNYTVKGACKSVIGNVRKNNEDNYYFNGIILPEKNEGDKQIHIADFQSSNNIICSVFDGMGGEANGEIASFIAAKTLKTYIEEDEGFSFTKYTQKANEAICNQMQVNNERMGTTFASAILANQNIYICNVGDSRIYGLKSGRITQLSKDHTEANLQEKLNIHSNQKPKLTQHLGIRKSELLIVPYKQEYTYEEYDAILLCSDGLTDMITDSEIENILSQKSAIEGKVNLLINTALEKGGVDNTTVILLEITKNFEEKLELENNTTFFSKVKNIINKLWEK